MSSDQLIDGLWGEAPPETAQTALHGYISQLRKRLELARLPGEAGTVLLTRPPGYLLRVEAGHLDLHRFEQLTAQGRRDLLGGEAERASAAFRNALALWRGPALGDIASEPFVQSEVARLEELRTCASEDLFDADLTLGRHHDLIPEIESQISRHPFRERLRAQLILALYRSGRQADALQAYQQTRRVLVDELGIEPGQALQLLERKMLVQDPSLDPPTRTNGAREAGGTPGTAVTPEAHGPSDSATPRRAGRPRRRAAAALIGLVAVAAIAGIVLKAVQGNGTTQVAGNSLALVDAGSKNVVEQTPVGEHPTTVAAGDGVVWVLNADDQTISRIEESGGRAKTFAIGETPYELAVGAGAVWVGIRGGAAVARLDLESGVVDRTIAIVDSGHVSGGSGASSGGTSIAVAGGAVWVVGPDRGVSRIDPRTNRVVATIRSGNANTLAAGDGVLWIVNRDSSVTQVDPSTNRVRATIRVPSNSLTAAAVGAGSLWLTDPVDGVVWRIDPRAGRPIMRTVPVEFGAAGIAFGKDAIWVSNGVQSSLTRIDPRSNRVTETIPLGRPVHGVTVGARGVWVSAGGSRATAGTSDALPQPPCGSVYYEGQGEPRFLIASDLPLQGGSRGNALSIIQAIQHVLRARSFTAGRYSVGYQFCDDATAQAGGFEYEKCASNASTYVSHPRVLGVVGSYNSDCSFNQIATTNRASLAMISPSNSAIGLSRASPSSPRGQTARLYPTGTRNYVRIYPADDMQAAAGATLARQLGCTAVFVLNDGQGSYALDMSASFVRASSKLRLPVAGAHRWDAAAPSYDGLARSIARSRADCVYLAGQVYSNGGRLLRDLRSLLGPALPIIASDGFSRAEDVLRLAGQAALGLYVSIPGIPTDRLGKAGQELVRSLRSSRPAGAEPNLYWGLYGGQAADLLLDAIARSDGTRTSVTRELRATRSRNGILGEVGFDLEGDVVPGHITIIRIEPGGEGMTRNLRDVGDGATVERVIIPEPRLVR